MKLLTVNAGSSSLRLVAFEWDGRDMRLRASAHRHDHDFTPEKAIRELEQEHNLGAPDAIAHRVVHGGARLTASCRIDAEVEAEIGRLAPLAPLHNPLALRGIAACRAVFGARIAQVAVFDTAFYASLPAVASAYALPRELVA